MPNRKPPNLKLLSVEQDIQQHWEFWKYILFWFRIPRGKSRFFRIRLNLKHHYFSHGSQTQLMRKKQITHFSRIYFWFEIIKLTFFCFCQLAQVFVEWYYWALKQGQHSSIRSYPLFSVKWNSSVNIYEYFAQKDKILWVCHQ